MSFEKALAFTLRWEGGYANVAGDKGGETNFGIADRRDGVADGMVTDPETGKQVAVKTLKPEVVAGIYKNDYWIECACGNLPEPLDMVVFDAAVNHGPKRALAFMEIAGSDPVKNIEERDAFYHKLVKLDATQGKFLKGWLRRTTDLRKAILA